MTIVNVVCIIALFILSIMLLCSLSHAAKFYIKLSCYYIAIFTVTLVAIPFSLRRPKDPGNLLYATWMVHHIISKIFGLKWVVKNPELLQFTEPCVMVCNHQSALDISGMMYIWPLFHPCVPVLKKELLFSGPFGIFCWLSGCIFVDRFNTSQARDTLNLKVKELKDRKVKVWIFPEGTRNDKGTLLPFKKGAFHIATQIKIPIVPLVFSQYSDFYSINKRIFDRGTITVTVLPSIETHNLSSEDVPSITEKVRKLMSDCLAESLLQDKLSNGNVRHSHVE